MSLARQLRVAVGMAFLLAAPATAESVHVGSVIEPIALPDQHGEPGAIDGSVSVLLFSHDMDGGNVVRDTLAGDGAALLDGGRFVYLADVSRMPGLVRRMIAKPRMRKRPYRMLLDEEGKATASLPRREGRPTLLVLEALTVQRIEHPATPEEIRAILEASQSP